MEDRFKRKDNSTKDSLAKEVSKEAGIDFFTCRKVLEELLSITIETINDGDVVMLKGFGTFTRRWKKDRFCRDIKRNIPVMNSAHFVLRFHFTEKFQKHFLQGLKPKQ